MKIVIKNFGQIVEADLELKPINVILGDDNNCKDLLIDLFQVFKGHYSKRQRLKGLVTKDTVIKVNDKDISITKAFEPIMQQDFGIINNPGSALFPSEQRSLLNRIVRDRQEHIIIGTNSPYIGNQINLLLKADDCDNTDFTENASIAYNELGAWRFINGKLESIKARNKHFIDVMVLSDDINDIYTKFDLLQNYEKYNFKGHFKFHEVFGIQRR